LAADGTPLNGCTVTITEEATGEVVVWNESREEWDPNQNVYAINMLEFMDGWAVGDVLNVTATKGALIGWNEGQVSIPDDNIIWIDVILNAEVFIMNLVTGWNHVSLPLVGYGYKASTLGLNPGDTVSEWIPTTKTYRSHIVGVPINDFSINPGNGYLINVPSGTRTLSLFGVTPTSSQYKTITIPAGGGWATVGFVGKDTTRNASDVPGMYSIPGSITMVSTWNPVTKTFRNWLSVIPSLNDFVLTPGLAYWILASASGTFCYGPVVSPVASFTITTDGLTVNVDASASTGAGLTYAWDWGDGTTGTGMSATHTYSVGGSTSTTSGYGLSGRGRTIPHPVFGYTYGPDGVTPLNGCSVAVTNVRTGESRGWGPTDEGWDPDMNIYLVDLSTYGLGYMFGDWLNITATNGDAYYGWVTWQVIDTPEGSQMIDVTLQSKPPSIEVTITLTVTDAIGQTSSVSKTVLLKPLVPPIVLLSCDVYYMNVTLDASYSISLYGTIVSYDWAFGDGGVASGVIVNHTYLVQGVFMITLTATDSDGLTGSSSVSVWVPDVPGPP
jgi:chitodextrinase